MPFSANVFAYFKNAELIPPNQSSKSLAREVADGVTGGLDLGDMGGDTSPLVPTLTARNVGADDGVRDVGDVGVGDVGVGDVGGWIETGFVVGP